MFWTRIAPPWTRKSLACVPLEIDIADNRARLNGRILPLSPLLFELLSVLAHRPGRLVTRQELKRALWPHAERIDTERRLNTAVRALRAALGDEAETPRFIETQRGRGYRWINQPPGRTSRPLLAWLGAAVLSGVLSLGPSADQAPGADLPSIIRAQAAVDQWRAAPTAAGLKRAQALLAAADDGAAVQVLKGNLALEGSWDWQGARRHYRAALAGDPDNADARFALAWLAANRGDAGGAMILVRQLIGSAALGEARRAELGWLLIRLGRPELAAEACSALPSSAVNLLSCAHTAAAVRGHLADARQAALALMRKVGADAKAVLSVGQGDSRTGYALFLDWRADHFLPNDAPLFQRAQLFADAGREQEALAMLEKSIARREPLAVKIGSSPSFSLLRRNPRFRALAMKVGVPA